MAACLAFGCRATAPVKPAGPGPAPVAVASVAPAVEDAPEPAGTTRVAVIRTERGTIKVALLDRLAPRHVRNFTFLAEKGFYNNLVFHRVVPGMLIQGGDPKGDGTGGPGYTVKAEFNAHPFVPGTVGMARTADPDSAGSQWFIALRPMPMWNGHYTVFGQVLEGLDVAQAVGKGDRMLEVRIERVPTGSLPAETLP